MFKLRARIDRASSSIVVAFFALVVGASGIVMAAPASAAFPGQNGKIAFSSHRDGNWEIYVMNADGTGLTNLTNNAGDDLLQAWSPDGTKIAFTSYRDGNQEIYVMNADGTGQTNVTNNVASDGYPAWSSDGTKIAFFSSRDGNAEIYVMNADGTGPARLTTNAAVDLHPAWSPDGTKIAFASTRDGNQEIYVMNADGTGLTNLTSNAGDDFLPAWSPDGTKIAFTSARDFGWEIYVMNADGTGQTNVTNNAGNGTNNSELDVYPAWSPDGTKIAFTSYRDGNAEIYVMNADGSNPMNLTNSSADEHSSNWQPLPAVSDSDGDGLDDSEDPDVVAEVVSDLPPTSIGQGNGNAFLSRLDNIESLLMGGDTATAISELESLLMRTDGCDGGTQEKPDKNDWIKSCSDQHAISALLENLIAALEG